MKKHRFVALALCGLLLTGCSLEAATAIDSIGTVTLSSGPAIAAAEESYAATPKLMLYFVDNYPALQAARTRYEELVSVEKQMLAQLDAVETVDASSGDTLAALRSTYAENAQKYAPEKFVSCRDRLEQLEKSYRMCLLEEKLTAAETLYAEERYAEAVALLEEIMSSEDAQALQQRCSELLEKSKKALAQQQRTQANALVKKDPLGAIRMLEDIDSTYRHEGDYQKIYDAALAQLKKNRPASGKVLEKTVDGGNNIFKISAKGSEDFCVKLELTEDSTRYILFYLRAGQSARIKVPNGTYQIKYCTGDYWCNTADYFYPGTRYMESAYTAKFSGTDTTYTMIDFTLYGSDYPGGSQKDTEITKQEF